MTTKLTLSLDEKVIKHAKLIANRRGKSLSKMVEEYFNSIPEKKRQEDSIIEQIEKRLKPYINKIDLPEEADYRNLAREWKYQDYLKSKGRNK